MICPDCMKAADARAPRTAHCDDPACMCGHRVDRYRTTTGIDVVAGFYDGLRRIADQTTEIQARTTVLPIGQPLAAYPMARLILDGEDPDDVLLTIPADALTSHTTTED